MLLQNINKFQQLVDCVIIEAKTPGKIKDATKYIAKGPAGLSRGGAETGPIKTEIDFIRRLEQNSKGERARDEGRVVASRAYSDLVKTFRLILAQPVQASQLIDTMENYSKVYRELQLVKKDLTSTLKGKASEELAAKRLEYEKIVLELAEELNKMAPVFYREVLTIMGSIYNDIVNLLKDRLDTGDDVDPEAYAKNIYNEEGVKRNFKKFVRAYSQGGEKNPIPLIISLFKAALISNKEDGVVGDLPGLIEKLTKKTASPIGNTASSHAGRQKLQRNKPKLARIVKLIKSGDLDKAMQLADEFDDVKSNIQKLKDGEMTEGDVVRAIYSTNS